MAALVVALAAAQPVVAHGGDQLEMAWWWAWNNDPWIIGGLLLTIWLYGRGVTHLWERAGPGRGIARWQVVAFAGGILALIVALLSPLEHLSESLFAAHMAQHLLLLLVAPPLLLLGAPPVVWAWALPRRWRRPGAAWWHRRTAVRRWLRRLAHPGLAWALYAAVLWLWHLPLLYEMAVLRPWVHALEHACFLGVALLFWWTLARPRARRRAGYLLGVLFVFTTALHNTLLGVLITFAPRPWYAVYAERTAAWGLTPLADQQLAGAIMWAPAGFIYLLAILALLYAWFALMERRDRRQALPLGTLLLLLVFLSGCSILPSAGARELVPGGDADRGRVLLDAYGCDACHTIPGVRGTEATVGPPLLDWPERAYIAGALVNNPENMMRWLRDPQAIEPGTAMPDLGVSEADARDMAAYLFGIR